MAQIVGLDIGTRTITGAVFTGNAKRYRLTDFFIEDVPSLEGVSGEGGAGDEIVPPASVGETVERLLAARGLEGADVVAAVDAKDCILREIPVPFTKEEHIRKTIHAEAENHFQTFDIEDVILEWLKVDERGDKSRVLIAAVRKPVVRDRLETLKQGGVDPLSLDLDAAALFNSFALTPTFDQTRTVLLIDMGATSTRVLLVEKGRLKKVRSIRMDSFLHPRARQIPEPVNGAAAQPGLLAFPDAYSIEARFLEIENALRRLEPMGGEEVGALAADEEPIAILTDEEYDLVRESSPGPAGDPPPRGPAGRFGGAAEGPVLETPPPAATAGAPRSPELDYQEYLQRLGLEVQRTFASVALSGIDLICLTGGMSLRDEARRFFTDEFDVETIHLDFGDAFPTALPAEAQERVGKLGAVAVGLAVKELGGDRVGFDFRKQEFRFERKFEKVKFPVLAVAALAFAVFLQSTFNLYNRHVYYARNLDIVRRREQEMFQAFFGKPNSSRFLFEQAKAEKKVWEGRLGIGGMNIPVFIDSMKSLQEVARCMKEVGQPRLEIIDFKFRTNMKGGKRGFDAASSLQLSAGQQGLATQIDRAFGRPGMLFSASSGENKSGPSGGYKVSVTLTPQDAYLAGLGK